MVRFAFTVNEGPGAGLTCGGWRLWTSKEDTYLTAKPFGHVWKVSLHGDAAWRCAVTAEHTRSPNPVWKEHDRAPWRFAPTPFADGERLAFAVCVTRGALRPEALDPAESHIRVEDRWDRLTLAYVLMTEPGHRLEGHSRVVAGPLPLDSGRAVWLTAGSEAVEACESGPVPTGTMVEPMWPERHGVRAPGMMVRGINVSS